LKSRLLAQTVELRCDRKFGHRQIALRVGFFEPVESLGFLSQFCMDDGAAEGVGVCLRRILLVVGALQKFQPVRARPPRHEGLAQSAFFGRDLGRFFSKLARLRIFGDCVLEVTKLRIEMREPLMIEREVWIDLDAVQELRPCFAVAARPDVGPAQE